MTKVFFSMADVVDFYQDRIVSGDPTRAEFAPYSPERVVPPPPPRPNLGGRRLETVTDKDGFVKRVWKGSKNLGGKAKDLAGKGLGGAKDLAGKGLSGAKNLAGGGINLVRNNPKTAGAVILGGTLIGAGGAYLANRD